MLGIDVNEIKEVKIQDAIFKIGIVPYSIKIKLDGITSCDGQRKVSGIIESNMNYIKYGVRGHSGIVDRSGQQIPFKSKKERVGERELDVVSDETIDLYMVTGVIVPLLKEIFDYNTLSQAEEKNS